MSVLVLLIRHGSVDFDSTNFRISRRGRQWDPSLSEQGQEQARRLTPRLLLMEPSADILLSPFQRCRETIEPYLRRSGRTATVDEDVGEVFVGSWEGMRFEDIVSGDEELARRFRDQEAMFSLAPGGETGAQLRARVIPAIERAIDRAGRGAVVVVTHGGVINAYLGHVMGIDQDMFFLPDNGSISTVIADDADRRVRFLNDVRHLTDPAVFAPPAGTRARTREGPAEAGPSRDS